MPMFSCVLIGILMLVSPCTVWAGSTSRNVIRELTVNNGGVWGVWGQIHYCAEGTYAIGYSMKIEGSQGDGDDTKLNSILLECEALNSSRFGGEIGSQQGAWGSWTSPARCDSSYGMKRFLTGFALQVESNQGSGDDTTANFAKFKCRDFDSKSTSVEMSHPPGRGDFGGYGSWGQECGPRSAICGIQTCVESPQGESTDDTAFNNAKMFCCSE